MIWWTWAQSKTWPLYSFHCKINKLPSCSLGYTFSSSLHTCLEPYMCKYFGMSHISVSLFYCFNMLYTTYQRNYTITPYFMTYCFWVCFISLFWLLLYIVSFRGLNDFFFVPQCFRGGKKSIFPPCGDLYILSAVPHLQFPSRTQVAIYKAVTPETGKS